MEEKDMRDIWDLFISHLETHLPDITREIKELDKRHSKGFFPRVFLQRAPPLINIGIRLLDPATVDSNYWARWELEQELRMIGRQGTRNLDLAQGKVEAYSGTDEEKLTPLRELTGIHFKKCILVEDENNYLFLPDYAEEFARRSGLEKEDWELKQAQIREFNRIGHGRRRYFEGGVFFD